MLPSHWPMLVLIIFFFSSRRRHTRSDRDWSSDVCSSDLLRKEGAAFDLPIAVGILAAEGLIPAAVLRELVMVGEVSLEGGIKPVHGALSMALACCGRGIKGLLVPVENAREAAIVEDVPVYPVATV